MHGVPAVVTNATELPCVICCIMVFMREASLNLWQLNNLQLILYFASSFLVIRVSSAKIRSTFPNIITARWLISAKLPIGVLMIYSFPFI
jgi:hypothetical protein